MPARVSTRAWASHELMVPVWSRGSCRCCCPGLGIHVLPHRGVFQRPTAKACGNERDAHLQHMTALVPPSATRAQTDGLLRAISLDLVLTQDYTACQARSGA